MAGAVSLCLAFMRFLRTPPTLATLLVAFGVAVGVTVPAAAQSVDEAEQQAESARRRAAEATGLVDAAVANRRALELRLAESISRLNEISTQLSITGAALDGISARLGFADVELADIQSDIEIRAVDAYMTVLGAPSVSWVASSNVEEAMVATSVVENVVSADKAAVDQLLIKRNSLVSLKDQYLLKQAEFAALQAEMDAEVARFTDMYEEADAKVAAAIKQAQAADSAYRTALSAVQVAQAREAERQRQEARTANAAPTTAPPTAPPAAPGTTAPPPTAAPPTSSPGGGGQWTHPPAVERWRSLVQAYFPGHRVEEALRIINCESNGDPNAYNPYSRASGLFQFIPSTWAATAPKAGFPDASAFDPTANVASAAWLANRYQELGQYYWQAWSCRSMLG